MKLCSLIGIFVSTCIAISHSNPNLRKGELIQDIITQLTKENYGEAINIFAVIGKLAKNHTVDLSDKEQKLLFDSYHYRRIQLRKDLVFIGGSNNERVLNREGVKNKVQFYNIVEQILGDLEVGSSVPINYNTGEGSHYNSVHEKLLADKEYFEAWYTGIKLNVIGLRTSYLMYNEALEMLKGFLGDAEPTVLDACLGFSSARLEFDTLINGYEHDPSATVPCIFAQDSLNNGSKASSESNPDLIPLRHFVNAYCKLDSPHIVADKAIKMD